MTFNNKVIYKKNIINNKNTFLNCCLRKLI